MRIYLPLTKVGGLYVADTDYINFSDWRDVDYLDFFENQHKLSHETDHTTVSIDGTEYKSCVILVPKNAEADHYYVAVDEDYIPLCFRGGAEEEESNLPHEKWVNKWLSRSRNSENYYHNYFVDLSTKYIAPRIIWDDKYCTLLNHPDSIRRGSRVLLVGQPGAGKTSFARYLTQCYLRDNLEERKSAAAPVVFFFQLREFAFKTEEFQSWLANEEEEAGKTFVLKKNRAGKAVFIFDGLDELNEDDRQGFTAWLNKFINTRQSFGTIVTSRELNSLNSGIWETFKKAKILPFDRAQVDEYCNLVVGNKGHANRFIRIIDSNPDLQEFLRNPFSLSLALGMFLLRGALPFNIGVLCKELVTQLIEKWDARRGVSRVSKISVESINSTLGRLAYRLQSKEIVIFSPEHLEDLLPVEIEQVGPLAVLQDLSERTGIVLELNHGSWTFAHRYLQDFFCANYLVEKASGLHRELDAHGRDSGWVDVWRQVGQLCQDPEFFALSQSRDVSDSIMSVDRMVSSLLSHDGLSKVELNKIIEGLTDEINREKSNLPKVTYTEFGAEFDCSELDGNSIQILAKTMMHLNYLKESIAGSLLLDCLKKFSKKDFAIFIERMLRTRNQSIPKVGITKLQVFLNVDEKSDLTHRINTRS